MDAKKASNSTDTSTGIEVDNVERIDALDGLMLELTRRRSSGDPKDVFGELMGEVVSDIPLRYVARIVAILRLQHASGHARQSVHDRPRLTRVEPVGGFDPGRQAELLLSRDNFSP